MSSSDDRTIHASTRSEERAHWSADDDDDVNGDDDVMHSGISLPSLATMSVALPVPPLIQPPRLHTDTGHRFVVNICNQGRTRAGWGVPSPLKCSGQGVEVEG